MPELLALAAEVLSNPTIRDGLKNLLFEVGHEIAYDLFVRRQDPAYAAKQDAIIAQKKAATTPQEILHAQAALAALMSAGK